jgi:hypothetical protein
LQDVIAATGRAVNRLFILMMAGRTGNLESVVMRMLLLTMIDKGDAEYS